MLPLAAQLRPVEDVEMIVAASQGRDGGVPVVVGDFAPKRASVVEVSVNERWSKQSGEDWIEKKEKKRKRRRKAKIIRMKIKEK